MRALQEIAAAKDAEAFDLSIDVIGTWAREERREGAKVMFQALAEKRIGRRDQANAWIWRLAEYTREVHEEYAVQRWPETKRLLGLLVNSSGGAHARNARRLVHAARKQDRRLQAALLAAAVAHTPEAEEVLRGARTRLARKPSALSRELLRNFPKGKGRRSRRRRKKATAGSGPRDAAPPARRSMRGRARRAGRSTRRWPPRRPTAPRWRPAATSTSRRARRPTATGPPRTSRPPGRGRAASAGATPIPRAGRAGRRPPRSRPPGGRGGADGGRGGADGGRDRARRAAARAAKPRSRRRRGPPPRPTADERPADEPPSPRAKAAADGSDDEQQPAAAKPKPRRARKKPAATDEADASADSPAAAA